MTTLQTELAKFSKEEIERQTFEIQKKISALQIVSTEDTTTAKVIEKECTSLEKLIEEKRVEIVKPLNDFVSGINALAKTLMSPVTASKEVIRKKQIEYSQKLEAERQEKEWEVLTIIQKINSTPDEVELELYADQVVHPDPRIKVAVETRRSYFEEQERQRKVREEQVNEWARLEAIKKEQGAEAARLAQIQAEERLRLQKAEDERKRIAEDARVKEAEEMAEFDRQEALKKQESEKVKGLRKVLKFEVADESKLPRELMSPDDSKIRSALKEGLRDIPGLRIWAEDKIQ